MSVLPQSPPSVEILLDPRRLLRWHGWLIDELRARGVADVRVRLMPSPRPPALPAGVELVLRLERLAGRVKGASALDPLSADDPIFAPASQSRTEGTCRTIDVRDADNGRDLCPLYDGRAGEEALWRALLAGRAPLISSRHGRSHRAIPMALPAIEDPTNLHAAVSMVLARVATALAQAATDAERVGASELSRCPTAPTTEPARGSVPGYLAKLVATKARRMRDKRLGRTPRWAVAYRHAPEGRTHPPAALDIAAFTLLADDGGRYYADPFLFEHQGQVHLFVEEVPRATGRGIISHCVLGRDGRFPTPRPILERPYHLSYPQVFAHEGQIWMMPETSAAGAIELYRAEPFPDRFVTHRRLIEGPYHDATFFERDGRLWIAAGSQTPGSSSWDALSLFHAERLEGPWTPHLMNPVLVDSRSARPAGEPYHLGGTIFRPSQDCSGGYGSALRLSEEAHYSAWQFAEKPVAKISITGGDRVLGPHTINFAGGIEVIDVFAPVSWRPGSA